MQGTEARRFCSECQKEVHAISEMSPEQAAELLRSAPSGTLCIRVEHDGDGRIFFREPETPPKRALPVLKMAMTASLLAACHGDPQGVSTQPSAQAEPLPPAPALTASERAENQNPPPVDSCAPKRLAPGSLPSHPPAATAAIPQPSKADKRITMGCACEINDPLCSCL